MTPFRRCAPPSPADGGRRRIHAFPRLRRAVRGTSHRDAGACPIRSDEVRYFPVIETQKGRPGMRYSDSILGHLLKPLSRRWFDALVERCEGDAYDKKFGSWDHLLALVYAQLAGMTRLRALEAAWNANAHHH